MAPSEGFVGAGGLRSHHTGGSSIKDSGTRQVILFSFPIFFVLE